MTVSTLSIVLGCKGGDQAKSDEAKTKLSPEELLSQFEEARGLRERVTVADELAALPAESLKPLLSRLQGALTNETAPAVRQALQRAVDKAKTGPGRSAAVQPAK